MKKKMDATICLLERSVYGIASAFRTHATYYLITIAITILDKKKKYPSVLKKGGGKGVILEARLVW